MITAIDKALHDAGKEVRDRRLHIKEIAEKIQRMSSSGATNWDAIRQELHGATTHPDVKHNTPGGSPPTRAPPADTADTAAAAATGATFTQPPREGFRQKRKYSKRVPSPTIAGTSLGN